MTRIVDFHRRWQRVAFAALFTGAWYLGCAHFAHAGAQDDASRIWWDSVESAARLLHGDAAVDRRLAQCGLVSGEANMGEKLRACDQAAAAKRKADAEAFAASPEGKAKAERERIRHFDACARWNKKSRRWREKNEYWRPDNCV